MSRHIILSSPKHTKSKKPSKETLKYLFSKGAITGEQLKKFGVDDFEDSKVEKVLDQIKDLDLSNANDVKKLMELFKKNK